jgi:hypothetical protein
MAFLAAEHMCRRRDVLRSRLKPAAPVRFFDTMKVPAQPFRQSFLVEPRQDVDGSAARYGLPSCWRAIAGAYGVGAAYAITPFSARRR